MNNFLEELSNPKWWFSTILAGIAVGLFVNKVSDAKKNNITNEYFIKIIPFASSKPLFRVLVSFLRVILLFILITSLFQFFQEKELSVPTKRPLFTMGVFYIVIFSTIFVQVYCIFSELYLINFNKFIYLFKRVVDILWLVVFFVLLVILQRNIMEYSKAVLIFVSLLLLIIVFDNLFIVDNFLPKFIGSLCAILLFIFAYSLVNFKPPKSEEVLYSYNKVFDRYYKNKDNDSYVLVYKFRIVNFVADSIKLLGISRIGDTPFFLAENTFLEKTLIVKNFTGVHLEYFTATEFSQIQNDKSYLSRIQFKSFYDFSINSFMMPKTASIEFYIAFNIAFAKNKKMNFDKLTINFDFLLTNNIKKRFYAYLDFSMVTPLKG
jgi:hypothetical protein